MEPTHLSPHLNAPLPAANWGSLQSVGVGRDRTPLHGALRPQTAPGGFAWTKPASAQSAESIALPTPGAIADPSVLRFMSFDSNDASHTTVHGMAERFAHIWDTRKLIFMHPHDMVARGLAEGDLVHVAAASSGEHFRETGPMRAVPYDLPRGCVGSCFDACNPAPGAQHPVRVKSAMA